MDNGQSAPSGPARLITRRRLIGAPLPDVDGARSRALTAVVRLASLDTLLNMDGTFNLGSIRDLCTATLIQLGSDTLAITAAHCFFDMDATQHLTGQKHAVVLEGVPPSALRAPRLAVSFATCAGRSKPDGSRPTVADCVAMGAQDIGLVPISPAPSLAKWRPCSAAPPTTTHFTLFGYGLNYTDLPSSLLDGDFAFQAENPAGTWQMLGAVLAAASTRVAVNEGDSGGPAIIQVHDEALATSPPEVCFVTSELQQSLANDELLRKTLANLQPTWDLEQRMGQPLTRSPVP